MPGSGNGSVWLLLITAGPAPGLAGSPLASAAPAWPARLGEQTGVAHTLSHDLACVWTKGNVAVQCLALKKGTQQQPGLETAMQGPRGARSSVLQSRRPPAACAGWGVAIMAQTHSEEILLCLEIPLAPGACPGSSTPGSNDNNMPGVLGCTR